MRRQKTLLCFIIIVSFSLSSMLPIFAEASPPPDVENVDATCVINIEHRQVMFAKDMTKVIFPASTVKLMTALVAYDVYGEELEKTITVTEEMLDASVGRNLSLSVGERLRVTDLLHAMLVGGYNDAATILAYSVAGGADWFYEAMNQKAKALGAMNTNYTNPTGLHDDLMVTTAYDTALIGMAIFENPQLHTMTKTLKCTLPATNKSDERVIYNRNTLITTSMTEEYYYSYAEGMSLGATDQGGDCLVTSGQLDGLSYICVVMGGRPQNSEDEVNHACVAAKKLLRYALVSYEVKTIYSADYAIATIPLRFSATEEAVGLKPLRDLSYLLHTDVNTEKEITLQTEIFHESLDAPVTEGTVVGTIKALYNGEVIDSTDLILTETIDSHGFLVFMYYFKKVTGHPLFLIPLFCGIVLAVVWLVWCNRKQGKSGHRKRERYFSMDDFE